MVDDFIYFILCSDFPERVNCEKEEEDRNENNCGNHTGIVLMMIMPCQTASASASDYHRLPLRLGAPASESGGVSSVQIDASHTQL